MDLDSLIDRFVAQVNFSPRETKWDAPSSVRIGTPDEQGYYDWNIKRCQTISWVDELEAKLPQRFPRSFHSLISRYIFPPFEWMHLNLLGNTPDGIESLYELRTGIFADNHLSNTLLEQGFIQFARSGGGGYDPICFDTSNKRGSECPIILIDHESILSRGKLKVTQVLAPSFLTLIESYLCA